MKGWKLTVARIAALIFVIGLTVFLLMNRSQVSKLGAFGYPGIFLVSILANATILLPLPGVMITSAMGAIFNPFLVAIAAGSGSALGELSGYLAGFSGQGVMERVPMYDRMEALITRYGSPAIFILALIPNPFFDMGGMIAGALKVPVAKFLFWCWLGKILKMFAFAYLGSMGVHLFPGLMD